MTARVLDITLIIWTARTGVISSRTTPGRLRRHHAHRHHSGLGYASFHHRSAKFVGCRGKTGVPHFLHGIGSVSVAVQNRIKDLT